MSSDTKTTTGLQRWLPPGFKVNGLVVGFALFVLYNITIDWFSADTRSVIDAALIGGGFLYAAKRQPPIAIAIALYYAMRSGGWFILAAAPVVVMLARRYQRRRLDIDANGTHLRRTLLLAAVALVATIPFAHLAVGAWSANGGTGATSASPLVPERGDGEPGVITRIARWLFGENQQGEIDGLSPVRPASPPPPDDPFNWWIVVAIAAAVLILALAIWWWRRRGTGVGFMPQAARPLARLEAIGKDVGRPRQINEGPLTYARNLSEFTNDKRVAEVGPMVSGQIYESEAVDPSRVDTGLSGLESAPPEAPPKPPLRQRLAERISSSGLTGRGVAYGLLGVLALIAAGWILLPRLGDLDGDSRDAASTFGGDVSTNWNTLDAYPAAWTDLIDLPADELYRWEICAELPGRGDQVIRQAGLATRSGSHVGFTNYVDQDSLFSTSQLGVRSGDSAETVTNFGVGELRQDWVDVPASQVAAAPFGSLSDTQSHLGLDDLEGMELIDIRGNSFTRFESPPRFLGLTSGWGLELGSGFGSTVFVVDVWLNSTGRPTRVRLMSTDRNWAEWRLTSVPDGTRRLEAPTCPTQHSADGATWFGFETWAQTVEPPALIGLDDHGNPFDTWTGFDPALYERSTLESSTTEITTFWIDGASTIVAEIDTAAPFFVDWHEGATISHYKSEGSIGALRLDQRPATEVARWVEDFGNDLYDDGIAIRFGDERLDPADLQPLLERFYNDSDNYLRQDSIVLSAPWSAEAVIRGYDKNDEVVSVAAIAWFEEWRHIGFEGDPPQSVKVREDELRACLADPTLLDLTGRCPYPVD